MSLPVPEPAEPTRADVDRAFRREVMASLPRAEIAALHVRRPLVHLAVASWQVSTFAVAFGLAVRFDDPRIWVPAAVWMGFGVLGFTILLHDVVHHAVFSRRRPVAERLLGLLYALPSGLAPSQFARWHLDHHDHLGEAGDPKRTYLSPKRNARWLKALYFTPALFPIYFRAAARGAAAYPPALRARIRAERLAVIGVHLAAMIGLARWGGSEVLARAYLVPYLLVFPVAFALNRLGQHYDIDAQDPAKTATRVDGNLPWRVLFLNSNHHLEHHWFPGVPLYNLPRLSRLLRPFFARRGVRNRTYGALLVGWFVHNRAPHSRWEDV
ncbi:MAG: fatty acid desaturase [Myxococcota bacterium]